MMGSNVFESHDTVAARTVRLFVGSCKRNGRKKACLDGMHDEISDEEAIDDEYGENCLTRSRPTVDIDPWMPALSPACYFLQRGVR